MFQSVHVWCVCLSPEQTLLAIYLGYLLTEFDQTFTTNDSNYLRQGGYVFVEVIMWVQLLGGTTR